MPLVLPWKKTPTLLECTREKGLEVKSLTFENKNVTSQELKELACFCPESSSSNPFSFQINTQTGDGASPNVKKDRRRFGLHKKKSSGGSWGGGKGGCSIDLTLPSPQSLPNQSSPSKPSSDAHDTSLPSVSVSGEFLLCLRVVC